MSDGRPVPVDALDSLDMYPGERFTVLIQPEEGYDGGFHAGVPAHGGRPVGVHAMDFRPGRFTHPSSMATLKVCVPRGTQTLLRFRSDQLGQKLHSLGPWGRVVFQGKAKPIDSMYPLGPTACTPPERKRARCPDRESLTLLSDQIGIDGVRLLSCWVHM